MTTTIQPQLNVLLLPANTLTRPVSTANALYDAMKAAGKAVDLAYDAWLNARRNRQSAWEIIFLGDEHTRAEIAYQGAIKAYTDTWKTPIAAAPVIEEVTAQIETAPVIQPAHMTDARRLTGIATWNERHQLGEIMVGEMAYTFVMTSILGNVSLSPMAKAQVSFAPGVNGNAASIVIVGNPTSEAAYAKLQERRNMYRAQNDDAQKKIDARLAQSRSYQRVGHVQLTSAEIRSFQAEVRKQA